MGADAAAPVKVLAVDDQPLFLGAVRELVEATPGFEPVGEAGSGPDAVGLAAGLHPDLILIDVRMPGMNGLETARRLRASEPRAVLVLISLEDPPPPAAIASAGVVAHVRKQDLSARTLQELWAAHGPPRR